MQAALQAIFQVFKLFVIPFAMISILAWPAASAFFRTLALEPVPEAAPGLRNAFQRAFASATQRYKENAVAFLAMSALSVVTGLNVLVTLFIIPSLWKMLTGYETDWSRMQDPTLFGLFAVAGVTTWFLMDPWIQTYCVLRVFYQNANSDGRDLLRNIARLAVFILGCVLVSPVHGATARQELDRGIDHVSMSAEYDWLRPQETTIDKGFMADLTQKVNAALTVSGNRIKNWSRALMYWLRNWLHTQEAQVDGKVPRPTKVLELRWTLGVLAVLICGGIVTLFLRSKKARPAGADLSGAAAITADVFDEQHLPSDVSQEEWLRLAFEYMANNQTRLAARAFYLANLSYLGAKHLLSLSLSKSNKLYERELARQPKSSELAAAFVAGNRLYERAWYGMRELAADQMDLLKGAADQLRHHA
jgi:hypothetical protein